MLIAADADTEDADEDDDTEGETDHWGQPVRQYDDPAHMERASVANASSVDRNTSGCMPQQAPNQMSRATASRSSASVSAARTDHSASQPWGRKRGQDRLGIQEPTDNHSALRPLFAVRGEECPDCGGDPMRAADLATESLSIFGISRRQIPMNAVPDRFDSIGF